MNPVQPSILFFDSGVGGFSVYREVKRLLPHCRYLYCFDNAAFPYSEKSEQTIIDRTLKICQKIGRTFAVDLIVIACNTASTVVLPALRQVFDVPVVGTVPAVKPAAEMSRTKHIGLLATKGTVKRPYVDDLIGKYAAACQVEKLGSTALVEIAEQKLRGVSVDLLLLRNELTPWRDMSDLDTVILGCTHFPLIEDEIRLCLPQVSFFMEPGSAIAQRVKHLLTTLPSCPPSDAVHADRINRIFCTQAFDCDHRFKQALHQWGFDQFDVLDL